MNAHGVQVWIHGNLEWKRGLQQTLAIIGFDDPLQDDNCDCVVYLDLANLKELQGMVVNAIGWVEREEAKAKAGGLA
jgi:hypothetical protein